MAGKPILAKNLKGIVDSNIVDFDEKFDFAENGFLGVI
jgi:hypothetical protein